MSREHAKDLIAMGTALAIILVLASLTPVCNANPLDEIDHALKTIKAPVAHVASVSALVVSLQTDLLGKDDVRAPVDIRKVTGVISPIQHRRDSVKNIIRQIGVVF